MTKEESIANRVKALVAKSGYTKAQARMIAMSEMDKPKAQMGVQQPFYNQSFNLDKNIQSQNMFPQQDFLKGNQDYLKLVNAAQPQNPAYQSIVNPEVRPQIQGINNT